MKAVHLLIGAVLGGATMFTPATGGAATTTSKADGVYHYKNVVFKSGTWKKSIGGNIVYYDRYAWGIGRDGRGSEKDRRLGSKQRAVDKAEACIVNFFASDIFGVGYKAACEPEAKDAGYHSNYVEYFEFDSMAHDKVCKYAEPIAKAAGKKDVTYSAKVVFFGDAAGTERDRYLDIGEIEGECHF